MLISLIVVFLILGVAAKAQECPPLYSFSGEAGGDHLGWGHSTPVIGDFNGDGYSDLLVGAPHGAAVGSESGQVYVLSGVDGALIRFFSGETSGDQFGHSVSAAGDGPHADRPCTEYSRPNDCSYECEGIFRDGNECANAVDGNWETYACPDAYGDSVKVIECHSVPAGVSAAFWRFAVLRNYANIEVRADYWNYATSEWSTLYEVPVNSSFPTLYVVEIPSDGLLSSPLKTRMHLKNATSPLVSGCYFEGLIDWVPADYECEGIFRDGSECANAVDGNWESGACPDAYGDSVSIVENHEIPPGAAAAVWHFNVMRNAPQIQIRAYYWDYAEQQWSVFFDVPLDATPDQYYYIYTVEVPSNGLLSSPLKTKMFVKNATMPQQSGYYYEGAVDWICGQGPSAPDTLFLGSPNYETSLNPYTLCYPIYLHNQVPLAAADIPLTYNWPFDATSVSFACTRLEGMESLQGSVMPDSNKIRVGFVADFSGSGNYLPPVDETTIDEPIAYVCFTVPYDYAEFCEDYYLGGVDTSTIQLAGDLIVPTLTDTMQTGSSPVVVRDSILIHHYRPGDCSGDFVVNITDVVCMISYIFGGGSVFCPDALDADCNGISNISDAVRLINYIFGGGFLPGYECSCFYEPPLAKLVPGNAILNVEHADHALLLTLDADREVQGVQLGLSTRGNINITSIIGLAGGLETFSGEQGDHLDVGLLDLSGQHLIASGESRILQIEYEGDGTIEVAEAIVVDDQASEMNVRIRSEKVDVALPESYSLSQNVPNPFNPTTNISFSLPMASQVDLEIFNIMGQKVVTLVDEQMTVGNHMVTWYGHDDNGASVPSGVYFYRLRAGEFNQSRKMLLLK